jgi:hypothetical protein
MSAIDTTKPVTGTPTTASVRANFATAAAEIDAAAAAAAAAQATADDAQPALGFTAENVANKSTDVTADGASDTKYPSAKAVKTYADTKFAATEGATYTLNPYTLNGNSTHAHGLGATPNFIVCYLQCLSADAGFSAGNRINVPPKFQYGNGAYIFEISQDNTYLYIDRRNLALDVIYRGTTTPSNLDPTKWKLIVRPFII